MTRRARRIGVVLLAALSGCSSAVLLYSKDPPPPASQRPPMVTATVSARAPAPPATALELEQFAPFVAEPRFAQVAELLNLDSFASAAEALDALRATEADLDTPLIWLWLGRLWERAGEPVKAFAACERASVPRSPLEEHARLCAARALIARKRFPEALKYLRPPPHVIGPEPEKVFESRPPSANEGLRVAVEAFREIVDESTSPIERARYELELSAALLALATSEPPPPPPQPSALLDEALNKLRHAATVLAPQKAERARIAELEQRILERMTPNERQRRAAPTLEERVLSITALVDARDFALAESEASAALLTVPAAERKKDPACELVLLRAKALAGARKHAAAVDALGEGRTHCAWNFNLAPRIFYLSGRYAISAGKTSEAIGYFAEVEKLNSPSSLGDDARFQSAIAEAERGVDARFTELMLSIPDRYPGGDMAVEALFRVAQRRMDRAAWADALGLLDRAIGIVGTADRDRGLELAGRERFFRARALFALGKRSDGLAELEQVILSFPLAYYMLQAYSWLERLEPGRAVATLAKAEADSLSHPFRIAGRPELDHPGFTRMMDLLRIGELDAAVRELDALGFRRDGVAADILWGVALLYERAGFSKFSSDLTRRRLGEVSGRWPVGEWSRAWQIAFPRPYLDLVSREAERSGVDPALVYGVMREESVFDPSAVSPANAYGLMQLIVPTAKNVARGTNLPSGPEALKQPRVNVALGCRELARLTRLFPENPLLVIPAYNAGPGRAARWSKDRPNADFDLWVEAIPYLETRRYIKRVLASRAVYGYLYERERAAERLTLPAKSGG